MQAEDCLIVLTDIELNDLNVELQLLPCKVPEHHMTPRSESAPQKLAKALHMCVLMANFLDLPQ